MKQTSDPNLTPIDADQPIVLRRRRQEDAELDITPMIDIVFLLLIFFLVCSSIEQQSDVTLAEAWHGQQINEKTATIITIDQDGDDAVVYLGDGTAGTPLSSDPDEQEDAVVEAVELSIAAGKPHILVKAAGDVDHGEVSRIAAIACSLDGVGQLHVAVRDKQ